MCNTRERFNLAYNSKVAMDLDIDGKSRRLLSLLAQPGFFTLTILIKSPYFWDVIGASVN